MNADLARAGNESSTGAAPGWRSMESAPMDGTEFLAWFQKHHIDDDGYSTDEVVGGAMAIISFTAGSWNEPQWLDAAGAYYMDDWCFAEEPVLWHPLPASPQEARHV